MPAPPILLVENELSVPGDPEHVAAAIMADHHLPMAAEQGGSLHHGRIGRERVAPRIAGWRRCSGGAGIALGSVVHLLTNSQLNSGQSSSRFPTLDEIIADGSLYAPVAEIDNEGIRLLDLVLDS